LQSTTLSEGRTGADGSVTLRFPADALVDSVFALKSGEGFDHWIAPDDPRPDDIGIPRPLVPRDLSLRLTGAMTARIRVTDDAGQPVAGVQVFSREFNRAPRGIDAARLVFQRLEKCRATSVPTDSEGIAAFTWLAADLGMAQFGVRSERYMALPRPHFDMRGLSNAADEAPRVISLPVLRLTKISGKVAAADGKPAAGIHVAAAGDSKANFHVASARSDADGSYELYVHPQCRSFVAVVDDDWAAVSRIVVTESEPLGGVDFQLIKGTLIRGTVTTGNDRRPVRNETIWLSQNDGEVPPAAFRPIAGRPIVAARQPRLWMFRACATEANGAFQFRVGPGEYTLGSIDGPVLNTATYAIVNVADEPEIVEDLHFDRPHVKGLSGLVNDTEGQPVPGAVIRAIYDANVNGLLSLELRGVSDAAGRFQLQRLPAPLWLFASSSDGKLAARLWVDSPQDSAALELAPAATVVGRLVDDEIPVAGAEVVLRMQFVSPRPSGALLTREFPVGAVKTGADGRFAMPGCIAGERFIVAIEFPDTKGTFINQLRLVDRPGTTDLEYIELPKWRHRTSIEERKVSQYVDLAARAASRFNSKIRLATRLSEAAGDAAREYRRVLLVLGDPATPATQSLFKTIDGIEVDPEFVRILADFRVVFVPVNDQNSVKHLAQNYQLDVTNLTMPAVALLGDDGKLAAPRSIPTAGDPPVAEVAVLRDFVTRHRPPTRNAEELVNSALRLARDGKKRVILLQNGPAAYPCRLLARFIERHHELFDKDYVSVFLDVDRMNDGSSVMAQYRKQGTAVPWMAILYSDGIKLADSDSPAGSIGFPAETEAINYFIDEMLKPTAQRLTTTELERLRTALGAKD
jgi:hypothetical protein